MDTSWIRGVIPPIVTPVDAEENVEEQGLRRVVEHVLAGGVHGILSLGSNGEFYGLDHGGRNGRLRLPWTRSADGFLSIWGSERLRPRSA